MNVCELRKIMELIHSHGTLPTDEFGQILSVDELVGWFGLKECLTRSEQVHIERELAVLVEAESAVERLRQVEQIRSSPS